VAFGLFGVAGYALACGTERWSVKTGTDPDAWMVDLSTIVPTSVSEMNTWQRPAHLPANNRADWVEVTTFQVYATITQMRRDPDGDYHIVRMDTDGSTLVSEMPDPSCVGPGSPFTDYIANARAQIDSVYRLTTTWHYPNVQVLVTGVGFWDINHGQAGRALNSIDVNPALDIQFP